MAQKKKYYAVAVGKVPGIYTQWFGSGGAEQMVRGVQGAIYKGFATIDEAREFIRANKGQKRLPRKARAKSASSRSKAPADTGKPGPPKTGQIVMYTDGGALNNPGPGGYGVVIVDGDQREELSGGYRLTTNNRMELTACIAGLSRFKTPRSIILYSDSRYVVNGITRGWAGKWKARGWIKSDGKPAVNIDLWEQLLALCEKHEVEFRWVKGHAGIDGNERCDQLATGSATGTNLAIDTIYEQSRE